MDCAGLPVTAIKANLAEDHRQDEGEISGGEDRHRRDADAAESRTEITRPNFAKSFAELAQANNATLIPFLLEGVGGTARTESAGSDSSDRGRPSSDRGRCLANAGALLRGKHVKLEGCTALITGASAGIGREFARQLAPTRSALVLVARRAGAAGGTARRTSRNHPNLTRADPRGGSFQTDDVNALGDWLERERIAIDFLINNAGSAIAARLPRAIHARPRRHAAGQHGHAHHAHAPTAAGDDRAKARRDPQRQLLAPRSCRCPASRFTPPRKPTSPVFRKRCAASCAASGITVTALCPGPVQTEFDSVAQRSDASERGGAGVRLCRRCRRSFAARWKRSSTIERKSFPASR